jgi:hypothetical protein
MWRVLVPLFRFAFDCWLGLGAFALVSFLVCGLWGIATLPYHWKSESFHR